MAWNVCKQMITLGVSCSFRYREQILYGLDKTEQRLNMPGAIGVNLRVTGECPCGGLFRLPVNQHHLSTGHSSQGGRKYMEDFFSVAYQPSKEDERDLEFAFFGIFDGHGGAEAAAYAKEHLMRQIINQKQFWSENDEDVLRAIREGYIATHRAMWREQGEYIRISMSLIVQFSIPNPIYREMAPNGHRPPEHGWNHGNRRLYSPREDVHRPRRRLWHRAGLRGPHWLHGLEGTPADPGSQARVRH